MRAELEELRTQIPRNAPQEFDAFLNLHLMILNDATLSKTPREIIETEQCNAEWALKVQMDALLDQFDQIEDGYLRERKADVIQVVERADEGAVRPARLCTARHARRRAESDHGRARPVAGR